MVAVVAELVRPTPLVKVALLSAPQTLTPMPASWAGRPTELMEPPQQLCALVVFVACLAAAELARYSPTAGPAGPQRAMAVVAVEAERPSMPRATVALGAMEALVSL